MGEVLVADIECDNLYDNVTKIHCICIKVKGEDYVYTYFDDALNVKHDGTIADGIAHLSKGDLVIGHNWIDYDCRVIKKFYPEFKIKINKIRDTLLRSYLSNPSRQKHKDCPVSKETVDGRKQIGAHSLENFGYVVGRGKVEHEDWTTFSEDMLHRCIEDVHITDLVDNYLSREMGSWDWEQAETIEKWFRFILSEQEGHGVLVDQDHIDWCIEQLSARINKIDKKVLPILPVSVKGVEKPTQAFKKDGAPTAYSIKYLGHTEAYKDLSGDYCKVEFNVMNLGSPKQVKDYLLSQGWMPENWNYKKDGKQRVKDKDGNFIKTSPKMKDESGELDPFNGISGKIPKLIVKRMTYAHRRSQIQGWKDRVRLDGRLGAGGNSVGTNCFTRDTLINTNKGVVNYLNTEIGDTVIDHEGNQQVIVGRGYNGYSKIYEVTTERGHSVKVTGNHPFLSDNKWVETKNLKIGDWLSVYGDRELWRNIPNIHYKISSWGRVKSDLTNRILKLQSNEFGHLVVTLDGENRATARVHRLVAEAFLYDYREDLHVLHSNGVPFDNNIKNLRMGTDADNMADTLKHGRMIINGRRKLSDVNIAYIKVSKVSSRKLSEAFGISDSMIRMIKRGERYKDYKIVEPKVHFYDDNVVSVKEIGWEDTYFIEVADTHSHLTNGIVTHNTGRVTHRTVVNVPKAEEDIFFGKEMRSTFIVPEGYKMVGADLSALENRVAAHYTYKSDGGEFAYRVLKECPHQYIADELSIERSLAKRVNYGIMYGAGVAKVQSILGCTFPQAKVRYGQWWDSNPALKQLRERIKRALEKHPGYLKGIDGRKIFIRSEHSAMNALFQNAGSMINKLATIMIYKKMRKEGIQGHFVINMHDEIQAEILEKDVDKYCKIVLKCYKKAGKYFNLDVPIEGEAKIGDCWADTH